MRVNTLKAFTARLQSFADNYESTAEKIIRNNGDFIADLQAKQLAKGVTSENKIILPEYSPYTIEQKKKKTGLAGVYTRRTMFDTGQFYKSLQTKINAGKFSIVSDSFKFPKLEKHYGVKAFGLTDDNARDFRDNVSLRLTQEEFINQVLR